MAATKTNKKKTTPASKKAKLQPIQITASQAEVPGVITLTKRSLRLLGMNWLTFGGIGLIYAIIGLLFGALAVSGYDVATARDQLGGKLIGGLGTYAVLLGSGGGISQDAQAYSLLFFVMVSLAIIWALRHVHEGKKVRIRDAYYKGMYPLVPFALVLFVGALTLLPALIGSLLFQYVMANNIAKGAVGIIAWGLGAGSLFIVTLYLLVVPALALYVVTLPNMTPVPALRAAARLVLGRRWMVIRKMLFLPLVLVVIVGIIMLPFILLLPAAAQWVLAILSVFAITLTHSYLYQLYRSTIDER